MISLFPPLSFFNPNSTSKLKQVKNTNFERIEEAIEEMGKFDIVVQSKLKEVFLEHILPLKEAA